MKIYVNFLSAVKPVRNCPAFASHLRAPGVSQTETKFTRSKDALTIAILAQYDSMCFVLNVWPPDQFAPRPAHGFNPARPEGTVAPSPAGRNLNHVAKQNGRNP